MHFLLDNNTEIEKIEILKNYIGEIKNLKIFVEQDDTKTEFEIKVNESPDKEKNPYIIIQTPEKNANEEKFNLRFVPKYRELVCGKISKEIFYEDIRYYGGMECFIPNLKIIKYFIEQFPENSEKIKKLCQKIIDIINVIINSICYSEKNYLNFKKILVPLLGALAEINHVLPENYQKELYNNHIFSSLYILIVCSSVPMALKKSYEMITGLNDVNKLCINFDVLILDINEYNFICFEWYSTILYIYIGFVLIVFNDYKKVPKNIISQLIKLNKNGDNNFNNKIENNLLIKLLVNSLNYICDLKEEENNILKNNEKVYNLSEFLRENKDNYSEFFLKHILIIIKALLNIIDFNSISFEDNKIKINININNNEINNNNEIIINNNLINDNYIDIANDYKSKYKNLVDSLEDIFKNNKFFDDKIKTIIIKELKDFSKHQKYLIKIFNFENNHEFELESELIIREFIDYHREYHKLMKNIFIYNRFWSDKKLFFNEEKKKFLKYKYLNYYTTNFQRPLIFPVLDYKYSYPRLTDFTIKDDFYIIEENKDDYKFSLCCPELDEFCIKYENQIKKRIEKDYMESIHIYNVCLVKRTHHIKGKLYILNKNGLIKKFLFHSFPKDIAKDIPCCNVSGEIQHYNHKKEKICYGEIFLCPEKDMNIKIFIDINDVRLILHRIYFYRKTAIEIFTNTKSYYFNFAEDFKLKNAKKGEIYCERVINMMSYYYKTEFFPIKINQNLMGYSRQFCQMVKKYSEENSKKFDLMEIENKYMSVIFDHWKPNFEDIEFSTFDMIIYLNLLSNRSYTDLYQYPIFPLLFFYEKNEKNLEATYMPRNLNEHIGFQAITEKSKIRKNMIKYTFNETRKENEEFDEIFEKPIYFKTHYSNNVYTSNFLIRLFPYSFLTIELQGCDFDTPDRLFFSIEETFYNISYQKSDVRELIPEFYYFPEIFMNLNKINFHERSNGKRVDDVEMPSDLTLGEKLSLNSLNNEIIEENYQNSNYFRFFKFIERMRNLLESKKTEINYWINIIFGPKQRYDNFKKQDQYFRDETYVDFTKDKEKDFAKYLSDSNIMTSVEFGISPVQTLFNEKEIINYKYRPIIYDNKIKDNKELYKELTKCIEKYYIDENKNKNVNNNNTNNKSSTRERKFTIFSFFQRNAFGNKNNNNYNENKTKNILKNMIKNEKIGLRAYKNGKVEIFINEEFFDELYDHTDEITFLDYNKRLNMFCTSSKDGYLFLYAYPNKLITAIKHSIGSYFDKVFLCSNPFPAIIAFDEKNFELFSFSINGFKILQVKLKDILDLSERKKNLDIIPFFNSNGGTYKDRLVFILENIKGKNFKCSIITLPFFNKEEKNLEVIIK